MLNNLKCELFESDEYWYGILTRYGETFDDMEKFFSHRQWFDRGGVQEFGSPAIAADGSVLEGTEGEPHRGHLCRSLLRPVGRLMEILPLNVDVPRSHFPTFPNLPKLTKKVKQDKITCR